MNFNMRELSSALLGLAWVEACYPRLAPWAAFLRRFAASRARAPAPHTRYDGSQLPPCARVSLPESLFEPTGVPPCLFSALPEPYPSFL